MPHLIFEHSDELVKINFQVLLFGLVCIQNLVDVNNARDKYGEWGLSKYHIELVAKRITKTTPRCGGN